MALFEFLKLKKRDEISPAPAKEEVPEPQIEEEFKMDEMPEPPELPALPPMPEKGKTDSSIKSRQLLPREIPEEIEISTKQYKQELPPAPSPKAPLFSFSKKTQQKEIPLPKPEFEEDFEESNMQTPEFNFPAKPMMTNPLEDVEFEKKYLASRKLNTKEPRFIRAQKYGDSLEELNKVRKIVAETDAIMLKFTEAESKRTHLYGNWQKQLEDMQRKLMYIDRTLFKQ